jgi:hypothetical protein
VVSGSSASKKWRLPTSTDVDEMEKRGLVPPPSSRPTNYLSDFDSVYNLKQNEAKLKNYEVKTGKIKLPGSKVGREITGKLSMSDEEMTGFVENFRDDPLTGELGEDNKMKILKAKEQIRNTDSDLDNPYLYYSSLNQGLEDDFVESNFNKKELEGLGINTLDFEGFLNKKGYKNDFLDKQEKGLFDGKGRDFFGGYDITLGKELAKKKLLTMYMEDMQRRDFTKQDLNQDIEIAAGFRKEKEIKNNQLFDQNGIAKYVEKNFPVITKKLKERDAENARIYEESKRGGSDFFSWETPSKMGKAGWNAIADRVAQVSSTAYDIIGMDATAEGIRMLDEENKLVRPDDRGVAYVSGKSTKYNGTNYIVDSKGEIYDADSKIRVTDVFNKKAYDEVVQGAQFGKSDWIFSVQGAAVQTSGVIADMVLQAALTRGVGQFGNIATEARAALTGVKQTRGITSLMNDTSQLLRKVPIKRAEGYSMIAQGALGYSQGYEETLKAARDNGLNDKEAFKLASAAAQRMAVLYSTTGIINPQTEVAENIFGSKNIIKKAIEQYTKTGEKGFVNYIDDIIKNTPRNLLEFAEEGGKEVVQENIQQAGEMGVNKMTNMDAGKKIMNDVMTGDDFMNTSILSFISSGLISKAKLPSFKAGNESSDDLRSLSTLAKNSIEFGKVIGGLKDRGVFTEDQVNKLKEDVRVYADNINKIPRSISPEIAMPVMREQDKITKLELEKKRVGKAFHEDIDISIEEINGKIDGIVTLDKLRKKNEIIASAVKKGVVKDAELKTFSNTQELENYLIDEFKMNPIQAKENAKQEGIFLQSDYIKRFSSDPDSVPSDMKFFFVNEDISVKNKNFSTGQHEFGHGLIYNTLKNDPETAKLLGNALTKELLKLENKVALEGKNDVVVPKEFNNRFKQYIDYYKKLNEKPESAIRVLDAKYKLGKIDGITYNRDKASLQNDIDVNNADMWEETITLYSDAISQGLVKYDEGIFTKLKDVIRQVLQNLGLKDVKFESGKDVYNFIKDYNKSVETNTWGKAIKKLGDKGAYVNKEALREETGLTESKTTAETTGARKMSLMDDRKSSDAIKKDVNSKYNKEAWSSGTNDRGENSAIDNVLYDILSEYDYIIKGKSKALGYSMLPDFSEFDMISETQVALIPHIRNFNKEFFQKREEFKKELISQGIDPKSKEFKDKVEAQDEKGYQGKKGIVKENDDLNAWINSQLVNKMKQALKSGSVTTQKFTEDIEGEMFKETSISDGFGGDEGYLMDEGDSIFEEENDFEAEQNKLAVLLSDPVYKFVDENGKPIDIETVPFGSFFITEASDPTVAANKKLKTETDPAKIADLKRQLIDLERGLELQNKKDITFEEKEELKELKSFKSYDLSTGMMVNTFEALSVQDTPAKIITDEVGREILRSPNIATLEYRNFKEKLSTLSKTMARRMTFKNGPEIESLMYNQWELLYDVINHPTDPVTGQSSYASKKLPPRLKETDDKGNFQKIEDITRVKFLQSYYGIEETSRIIKIYGGENANKELRQLENPEVSDKDGKALRPTTYFDRRTALMELFGDVLVLQEARRLIRQPEFLERIAERNVNLYNELKDDVVRAQVLNDMAKGKSSSVKFSLAENTEDKNFKNKFPKLLSSKSYIDFSNRLKEHTLYHGGSESIERTFKNEDINKIWFSVDFPEGYGDGIMYRTTSKDMPGAIIIPDINRSYGYGERFFEKFPEFRDELIEKSYDIEKPSREIYKDGELVFSEEKPFISFEDYSKEVLGKDFDMNLDEFLETKEYTEDKIKEVFRGWLDSFEVLREPISFEEYKETSLRNPFSPGLQFLLESKWGDEVLTDFMNAIEEDEDKYIPDNEGVFKNKEGKVGKNFYVIAFGKLKSAVKIDKKSEDGSYSRVKFSLAEEENGRISDFLEGLPFTEQWVVARDIDTAIKNSKTTDGTKVTFKVPSRSKMSDKSTAYFIIEKVAEGYNDFEFMVKKNATGPLTKQVLDALDFKSKKYQETAERNANLERTMNEIIEENKGVKASETFSPETAKNLGKNIGKTEIFLPPEDEDFLGLMYTLASGKGKQGQDQLEFLTDNLLKPYSDAMLNLMKARQIMYKDWKELINKKHKGVSKLLKEDSGYGGYLNDQAVRVYLWSVAGYDIPGLDKKDLFNLREKVRTNPILRSFAQDVSLLSKQANGYIEPGHNWGFGSVVGDINNIISKSNRAKYLEPWMHNVEKIFSKQNLSKIEAVYGRNYVKALNDMLARMKTGSNRVDGSSDGLLNWLNGSTAVTMFWNTRSAILQTLGAVNYINTSDNNVVKAGAAVLNVPQYMEDFWTIWNSDYLKDRRSGLMNDVAEAELAQAMNDSRNKTVLDKFKSGMYWLLKTGFTPTRWADSFAIAFGGAGFYRNRINTYLKKGETLEEAKHLTMRDFYEISEISQQSADVSKISMNQASVKGRLILAFMNTPLQYSRIIKKSVVDLAKGRGSVQNNIAKIVYYAAIQNIMFNFMQNALFAAMFDDDDEQVQGKYDSAKMRALTGTMDTLLKGSGLQGALLATVKNVIIKWYENIGDPEAFEEVAVEIANVAPAIGIKTRALYKSYKAVGYNVDEIKYKGFSLDNTYAVEALTSLTSATVNLPADRLFIKAQNVSNALNSEYEAWQRIAFALGYSKWNLGLGESGKVSISTSGMLKVPELSQGELVTPELK